MMCRACVNQAAIVFSIRDALDSLMLIILLSVVIFVFIFILLSHLDPFQTSGTELLFTFSWVVFTIHLHKRESLFKLPEIGILCFVSVLICSVSFIPRCLATVKIMGN